jgi:uncharacterized protein
MRHSISQIQQRIPTAIVLTIYEAKGSEFNDVLVRCSLLSLPFAFLWLL